MKIFSPLLIGAATAALAAGAAEAQTPMEVEATADAQALLRTQSYTPPLTSSGPRDLWCAAHHDDPPPLPYDFGPAEPYGY